MSRKPHAADLAGASIAARGLTSRALFRRVTLGAAGTLSNGAACRYMFSGAAAVFSMYIRFQFFWSPAEKILCHAAP